MWNLSDTSDVFLPSDSKSLADSTARLETNKMTVAYRVQPVGLDLADHRSLTSNDELDRGVHVCLSLEELAGAVNGWCRQGYTPEVITIGCDRQDIRDNGDYEGFVLVGNRGTIINRTEYRSWGEFADACREYAL